MAAGPGGLPRAPQDAPQRAVAPAAGASAASASRRPWRPRGITPDRRPQTLSVEEWLALSAALGPLGPDSGDRSAPAGSIAGCAPRGARQGQPRRSRSPAAGRTATTSCARSFLRLALADTLDGRPSAADAAGPTSSSSRATRTARSTDNLVLRAAAALRASCRTGRAGARAALPARRSASRWPPAWRAAAPTPRRRCGSLRRRGAPTSTRRPSCGRRRPARCGRAVLPASGSRAALVDGHRRARASRCRRPSTRWASCCVTPPAGLATRRASSRPATRLGRRRTGSPVAQSMRSTLAGPPGVPASTGADARRRSADRPCATPTTCGRPRADAHARRWRTLRDALEAALAPAGPADRFRVHARRRSILHAEAADAGRARAWRASAIRARSRRRPHHRHRIGPHQGGAIDERARIATDGAPGAAGPYSQAHRRRGPRLLLGPGRASTRPPGSSSRAASRRRPSGPCATSARCSRRPAWATRTSSRRRASSSTSATSRPSTRSTRASSPSRPPARSTFAVAAPAEGRARRDRGDRGAADRRPRRAFDTLRAATRTVWPPDAQHASITPAAVAAAP